MNRPRRTTRGGRPPRRPFSSRDIGLWMQVLLMVFVLAVVIVAGRQFARSISGAIETLTATPDVVDAPTAPPATVIEAHEAPRIAATLVHVALESSRRHVAGVSPSPREPAIAEPAMEEPAMEEPAMEEPAVDGADQAEQPPAGAADPEPAPGSNVPTP